MPANQPTYIAWVRNRNTHLSLEVRKAWWLGPGHGGTSRQVCEFDVPRDATLSELETVARALEECAAALRGRLPESRD